MNYCPRCGSPMEQRLVEGRVRAVCPACGHIFYRNPIPVVGVVVALDGRVVLVQRRHEPRAGCWGLPAGFMELDESAEEAAIRECHEETGLIVAIDHLLGVYSYGAGNHSGLVIIYVATAVGGALEAGDDATNAGAFALDALPSPIAFHTHLQAIECWRQHERLWPGSAEALTGLAHDRLVRRARRDDNEGLLALLALLPYHGDADASRLLAADALFHSRLHDPDRPMLVAEMGGAIAGFASLDFHQSLTGWRATIDDLAVAPQHRRRGLGQALVAAAARLAQARGCRTLHIDITTASPEARAFYHACGFLDGGVATLHLS